jgi:hypothetical protein
MRGVHGLHDLSGLRGDHSRDNVALSPAAAFRLPGKVMTEEEERLIREELERLRQEHRDLDEAIAAMEAATVRGDPIRRQRLKKRKLQLKDRIVRLEDRLLPDIIA